MSSASGYPRCGVTYISQMEHEFQYLNKLSYCNNCFKLGFNTALRRCQGCLLTDYCSRECQKANWSKHKHFCNMVQGKGKKNAYLSSLDHDTALRVLIDAYRLRVENDHAHRSEDHGIYHGGKWVDGLVWKDGDAEADFQRWLDLCEVSGILPEWWRFEDRMETLSLAIEQNDEESIYKPINQEGLLVRYGGDTATPYALRILAELVVGYDGKGPAKDGKWFEDFQEFLDLHPQERARLIKGTVDAVKSAIEEHGREMQQPAA